MFSPGDDIVGGVSCIICQCSHNVKAYRKLYVIIYSFSFHNPVETYLSCLKSKETILGIL